MKTSKYDETEIRCIQLENNKAMKKGDWEYAKIPFFFFQLFEFAKKEKKKKILRKIKIRTWCLALTLMDEE